MARRNDSDYSGKIGGAIGAERQQSILALINRGGIVSVGEFAERFDVSQETIRRDIRILKEAGHLRRVHGGAAPTVTFDLTARRPVVERLEVDREAKIRAAKAAMALFVDDMNVYLGSSSTMLIVAEELARSNRALTVTTNMIDIATVVAASGRCTVTLLGGIVDPKFRSVGGYEVLKNLERRLFDLCVMGASAVSPIHGILGATKAHNVLVTTLVGQSHRSALVMDRSKFGRRDAHVVLPLDELDFLATDSAPPEELATALEKAGVAVLLPSDEESRKGEMMDLPSVESK